MNMNMNIYIYIQIDREAEITTLYIYRYEESKVRGECSIYFIQGTSCLVPGMSLKGRMKLNMENGEEYA